MKHDAQYINQFEQRKRDHIRHALDEASQTPHLNGLSSIKLLHEALPELDFDEVDSATTFFNTPIPYPFFVSSMTAGHEDSMAINQLIAETCQQHHWPMGVGSQRRQLFDDSAKQEWKNLRRHCPHVKLMGNIGLSQLVMTPVAQVQSLAESLQAVAMIVHTNPLQECLQAEGTPHFKGGYAALEQLCKTLSIPVIIKETGCGFSNHTLKRLNDTGVAAVDISGSGGTHWGRIEGMRHESEHIKHQAAQTFKNWGIDTVNSLQWAVALNPRYALWASGGIRSGLDAAKLIALGAQLIGFAQPIMQAALQGAEALDQLMSRYEFELKMALFLTGSATLNMLQEDKLWR